MGLTYLMLENLTEVLNTIAKAFLEEQQDIRIYWFDSLFVSSSVVMFAKMLAPNCKLANRHHVVGHWQMIGSTNQLLCPRNERGQDLLGSAVILMLEH